MTNDNGRPDILRFVILVVILIVTLIVIAALRPLIFDRIVPAIIGTGDEAPLIIDENEDVGTGGVETPESDEAIEDEVEEEEFEASEPTADELPTTAADDSTIPVVDEADDDDVFPTARPALRHTVAAGETLAQIATRYNISVELIRQANQIEDINRIAIGQELLIPQP